MKKNSLIKSFDESLVYVGMPYSSIGIKKGVIPSSSSSVGIIKSRPITSKRRSSTISLNNMLSRRKSLQTTALATRRQSLWMNISKTPSINDDNQTSILPLRQEHTNLVRKKILRLLLVFSYLLSISLLAIALAIFYGLFWTVDNSDQTTNVFDLTTTVRSFISLTSNSTSVVYNSEIE